MKFESLEMTNFMRYEGVNRLEFSCDPERNVTVVLGDNTVGKTTIAQAFRWGLYGVLMQGAGRERGDIQLLNNDVAGRLSEDSKAPVSVEIVFVSDENRYRLKRSITYTHKEGAYGLREVSQNLELYYGSINNPNQTIQVERNKIDNTINEIMPMRLSSYFLFDGENWNDIKVEGIQADIKSSVHVLTGLSSIKNAMNHLKDMGSQSVISRFKSNITGNGSLYDNLVEEVKRDETAVERLKEQKKTNGIELARYQSELEKEENRYLEVASVEAKQKAYRNLKIALKSREDRIKTANRSLVDQFSEKAYMILAKPLIQKSLAVLIQANVEKRDIPHMRQATIDYLIERKKCICGTPLCEGSAELEMLLKQRDFLPPADLGSVLGEFEKEAKRWTARVDEYFDDLYDLTKDLDFAVDEYRESKAQIEKEESQLDLNVDVRSIKEDIAALKTKINRLLSEDGSIENQIENRKKHIESLHREMESCEAKTQENAKWKKRIQIAEELYQGHKASYDKK